MADNLMQLQRQAARRVQRNGDHRHLHLEAHQSECDPPACPCEESHLALPQLEAEQWLLLGLALLLMRCGGKTELTLALLYLAL